MIQSPNHVYKSNYLVHILYLHALMFSNLLCFLLGNMCVQAPTSQDHIKTKKIKNVYVLSVILLHGPVRNTICLNGNKITCYMP